MWTKKERSLVRESVLKERGSPAARRRLAVGRWSNRLGCLTAGFLAAMPAGFFGQLLSLPDWGGVMVWFASFTVLLSVSKWLVKPVSNRAYLGLVRYGRADEIEELVFYLRAFVADRPTDPIDYTGEPMFEEELALAMRPLGTVCGLASPAEEFPPLGVTWIEVPNPEGWKDGALALAARAKLIVVQADLTPGLVWEIEEIVRRVDRSRLLVLMPQHHRNTWGARTSRIRLVRYFRGRSYQQRYETFREALPALSLPEYSTARSFIGFRFLGDRALPVGRARPPNYFFFFGEERDGWRATELSAAVEAWITEESLTPHGPTCLVDPNSQLARARKNLDTSELAWPLPEPNDSRPGTDEKLVSEIRRAGWLLLVAGACSSAWTALLLYAVVENRTSEWLSMAIFLALGAASAVLSILSGIRLLSLRANGLGVGITAAVLTLIPSDACCVLKFLVGLLVLKTVLSPKVRDLLSERAGRRSASSE